MIYTGTFVDFADIECVCVYIGMSKKEKGEYIKEYKGER